MDSTPPLDLTLRNLDLRLNVTFLIPELPATEVVMLKRSLDKDFAPGLYTGIGGRYRPGEDVYLGAKREVHEETGLISVFFRELARCLIHTGYGPVVKVIHYFTGLVRQGQPVTCNEGSAAWVPTTDIFELPIIPTTRAVMEGWARRNFSGDRFTVHLHRADAHQADSPLVEVIYGDGFELFDSLEPA